MTNVQAIILIGNAGAGKTWVGEVLSRGMGLEFLDLERMLLERYGTTEEFIANKPEALKWFEAQVRNQIADGERTVIFEVGAFSQQETIRRLREDFETLLVLVEAPRHVRLQRLRDRERGRNLTEDPEESVRHEDVFESEVKPKFDFAFRIENSDRTEEELNRIVREEFARHRWDLIAGSQ